MENMMLNIHSTAALPVRTVLYIQQSEGSSCLKQGLCLDIVFFLELLYPKCVFKCASVLYKDIMHFTSVEVKTVNPTNQCILCVLNSK